MFSKKIVKTTDRLQPIWTRLSTVESVERQLKTAKTLISVLTKNHPDPELVARANRWLKRN